MVALSVSISTSSSPWATSSPSDLSHLRIVPSSIESDRRGMATSGMSAMLSLGRRPPRRGGRARAGSGGSGADELALGAQPVGERVAVDALEVDLVGAQGDLLVRDR